MGRRPTTSDSRNTARSITDVSYYQTLGIAFTNQIIYIYASKPSASLRSPGRAGAYSIVGTLRAVTTQQETGT
jgi:hypothetical protein